MSSKKPNKEIDLKRNQTPQHGDGTMGNNRAAAANWLPQQGFVDGVDARSNSTTMNLKATS
ncbi:hypothetical protein A2U01_0006126 [Trifolium medium]|uniref:Uncharacterized protein n=1 Tax=Trifolium medium TaxID=97028 RepID=A0A392MCQ4_9FABA|nr:hypothetical protein [Trifolium medium]